MSLKGRRTSCVVRTLGVTEPVALEGPWTVSPPLGLGLWGLGVSLMEVIEKAWSPTIGVCCALNSVGPLLVLESNTLIPSRWVSIICPPFFLLGTKLILYTKFKDLEFTLSGIFIWKNYFEKTNSLTQRFIEFLVAEMRPFEDFSFDVSLAYLQV